MTHTASSIHNAVVLYIYHSSASDTCIQHSSSLLREGATWSKCAVKMWCSFANLFLIPCALSLSIKDIIWWLFSVPCSPIRPSPTLYIFMCGMQCFSNMYCFGMVLNGNIFLYIVMYLSIAASVLVSDL